MPAYYTILQHCRLGHRIGMLNQDFGRAPLTEGLTGHQPGHAALGVSVLPLAAALLLRRRRVLVSTRMMSTVHGLVAHYMAE